MHTTDKDQGLALIENTGVAVRHPAHGARQKDLIYMHPSQPTAGARSRRGHRRPRSVVYDEAENRLHVQKALMALTM